MLDQLRRLQFHRYLAQTCNTFLIRASLLAVVSILLPVVTSAEKARVDSEKIGQLLCTIFSHSDIPSGLSQFGEVIHNGNPKEPEWEVDGELFNVSYSFSRDEDGPNSFDVLIHSSNRAGSIFPNESVPSEPLMIKRDHGFGITKTKASGHIRFFNARMSIVSRMTTSC